MVTTITNIEKERILSLHESATKRQYLPEQSIYRVDGSTARVSSNFDTMIKNFEGDPKLKINNVKEPALIAYPDGGSYSIGYGHHTDVKKDSKITKQQALMLLKHDVAIATGCINRMFRRLKSRKISCNLTQNQFDVLVSLVFNIGCGGVINDKTIMDPLEKCEMNNVAKAIKTFKLGGGKDRREEESKLFLGLS